MAKWRYVAYDLRTNTLLSELPVLNDVSFGGVLNGAGPFKANMPLNQSAQSSPGVFRSMSADLLAATVPGRTVVYVERDGVLLDGAAFIIWTRRYSPESQIVELGGLSLWSYFARRANNTDLIYTEAMATDQMAVARGLLNAAQAQSGGNIAVTVGAETSGVPRIRNYYAYEHKPVAEAVEQLSAVENGFDFAIDVAYVAGAPTRTFRCSYPFRGRSSTDTGHVFETGRNIVTYTWPEDATTMADRVFAIGSGDGRDMLTSTAVRTDVIDIGYPLLDTVAPFKDVSDPATLDAHARAINTAQALPVTVPEVTVLAGGDPAIGAWILGDYAKFVFGSDPLKPDARFPTRTELFYRIVGYSAAPGNEGDELIRLILN